MRSLKNEETGEVETRIVSIQEQQAELSALGWKHVELVDDTKLQCPEYYSVRIVPYDAGDKIAINTSKDLTLNLFGIR